MKLLGFFHQSFIKSGTDCTKGCNAADDFCGISQLFHPFVYINVCRIYGWISQGKEYYIFSFLKPFCNYFCSFIMNTFQFFSVFDHGHWQGNHLFAVNFRVRSSHDPVCHRFFWVFPWKSQYICFLCKS